MLLRAGLLSISFRKLSVEQLIAAVVQAQLAGIEWGGDIHVPHGCVERAKKVAAWTRDAGLHVAAYGSYYRAGVSEQQGLPFDKVLDSAVALGAPTIRVWAGAKASAKTTPDERQRIVDDCLRIARLARAQNIEVAFEYHPNTLTDTRASAQALLQATHVEGLAAYWQPAVAFSPSEQLASLSDMLPYLANLHVFHWAADGERLPLSAGTTAWRNVLHLLTTGAPRVTNKPRWAMLEFVRDNTLEQFQLDAAVLRHLLEPEHAPSPPAAS